MESPNLTPAPRRGSQILATDLDGTLIPLDADPQNQADLQTLAREFATRNLTLIYVTGRHFASAMQAIRDCRLPPPAWLICDVGTTIFQRQASGRFELVDAYRQHQDQIIAPLPIDTLRQQLLSIDGLRLQEPESQGRFKLSFYADAARLDDLVARLQRELEQRAAPYSMIPSTDPFTGDGLIDLLPATVSKEHALAWWVQHSGANPDAVVFSGDSGNDLAALTAGYRAILVGNADRSVAQQVYESHRESGWKDRLYLARGKATSGVLEGCRWFGLLE
jgi:hydroxymethylpyrimidine pyrophosphatase-like HAD family hydrolase